MSRTTAAAVKLVLNRDYDFKHDPDLTPYIDAASSLVDDVADCAVAKGAALSDAKLELIERWLSAHFYQQSDMGFASKSTQGASASFHGRTDMGGDSTLYGQSAQALDPSGCLRALLKGARASLEWLGKTTAEQIPYDQR